MKIQSRIITIVLVGVISLVVSACSKKPKVQLQVSRDRIQQGEDVRLTWTSKDAKQVSINGEKVDKDGSKIYTPADTTTYTVIAARGEKEARDSKSVNVDPRSAQPSITITADQGAIQKGQSTTLRWSSANADRVSISDLGSVPATGSRAVSPSQSTTYTATALGPGGNATASARVTVTEETLPSGVTGDRPRTTTNVVPGVPEMFRQWVQPIYFEYNKAELTAEAIATLRRAAQWLTQGTNRSITFRIEGNCDPRGTEEYNIGLGERRAQAAKEYLIAAGIDTGRIQTLSYGEEKATGGSEDGWIRDRRDDFIYVGGGTPTRN